MAAVMASRAQQTKSKLAKSRVTIDILHKISFAQQTTVKIATQQPWPP
mgnify:CR=1 FL=1